MFKPFPILISSTVCLAAIALPLLAQTNGTPTSPQRNREQTNFQGRGVAQGASFNRGRNVNANLIVNQGRFTLELFEPTGTRARVQYRGSVMRQNNTNTPNSFVLDGRVQNFDSSINQRIVNNTTGNCRIEVYNSRVNSSTCRTPGPDSNTDFLGLERF